MKFKVGIAVVVAAFAFAFTGYAEPAEAVEEAQVEVVEEAQVVLPWETEFNLMGVTARPGGDAEPYPCERPDADSEEPTACGSNVWCCKPDGNCAKIKASKCTNIGGVQHPTQAACTASVNC